MELFAGGVTMIQLDNFFGSFIEIAPVQFNLDIGKEQKIPVAIDGSLGNTKSLIDIGKCVFFRGFGMLTP